MSDREDFAKAVKAVSDPDPYTLIWPAEVVVQNEADGSLDLAIKDGPLAGEYLGVMFRPGLASYQVIAPGERVEVAFEGGQPDGIFAFTRTFASRENTRKAARQGDPVDLGYLVVIAPPGGGPCTLTLSDVPLPDAVHLTGIISDGSTELRIT